MGRSLGPGDAEVSDGHAVRLLHRKCGRLGGATSALSDVRCWVNPEVGRIAQSPST
jgi:hypothetical protein